MEGNGAARLLRDLNLRKADTMRLPNLNGPCLSFANAVLLWDMMVGLVTRRDGEN
jgi:hypothetical protein